MYPVPHQDLCCGCGSPDPGGWHQDALAPTPDGHLWCPACLFTAPYPHLIYVEDTPPPPEPDTRPPWLPPLP